MLLAASALGKIGGESAIPTLVEALKGEDSNVRSSAASALGEIGGESAVPALIEILKDEDSNVRRRAAAGLEQIAVDSLASGLKLGMLHGESFVRGKAAELIGYYSDEQCEKELRRLVENDPDHEVRQIAEDALARLRFKGRLFSPDGDA